ncbi:MAG: ABC transporter permease [Spirochaetota bacterium]
MRSLGDILPLRRKETQQDAKRETQWYLFRRKFRSHRLATVSLWILLFLVVTCVLFPEFFAPYSPRHVFENQNLPPSRIRFFDEEGRFHLRPFVYGFTQELDAETWKRETVVDTSDRRSLRFFVRGDSYRILSLVPGRLHLFGVDGDQGVFLFGTDELGRDLFSRTLHATRVSMTIGLVGVLLSTILGLILGGISGLQGGWLDGLIQRSIDVILSIPTIPLWMALAASVPRNWSPITIYFMITIIISLIGWTGLARTVRGKFLSLRKEDFVLAAVGFNAPLSAIIAKHLIPNFLSYVLVSLTLSVPAMILGETALSFLGIGLQPPVVSLGVLIKQAQNIQDVTLYPWLLIPGAFVVVIVLLYNFIGDGLRDAADPYS